MGQSNGEYKTQGYIQREDSLSALAVTLFLFPIGPAAALVQGTDGNLYGVTQSARAASRSMVRLRVSPWSQARKSQPLFPPEPRLAQFKSRPRAAHC